MYLATWKIILTLQKLLTKNITILIKKKNISNIIDFITKKINANKKKNNNDCEW